MYDNLLFNKNQLSIATTTKIKDLVKDVTSPIEKAKIVYEYVQNKTRYISVQVDIGGWQPITANKVDEVSYGDCKGLTNYTKALLDVVGVKSHHVILYASNNRNVDKNFTGTAILIFTRSKIYLMAANSRFLGVPFTAVRQA